MDTLIATPSMPEDEGPVNVEAAMDRDLLVSWAEAYAHVAGSEVPDDLLAMLVSRVPEAYAEIESIPMWGTSGGGILAMLLKWQGRPLAVVPISEWNG